MDKKELMNTYKFKIILGVTDLMGVTNDHGEFVGCALINDIDEYFKRKPYYDALINMKNEEYIVHLHETGEFGKEVECDLNLIHNELFDNNKIFDGPTEAQPIENFHPLESFRLVFLDTEVPSVFNKGRKLQLDMEALASIDLTPEEVNRLFEQQSPIYFDLNKDPKMKQRTKELIDSEIKAVKEQRVAIDKSIQEVKGLVVGAGMAEKTIALRKLQEAKMWLGQVLAELGAETPYIHADNVNNAIVSPSADVFVKKADNPIVSIHFTLKGQSKENLQKLLHKLTTTWEGSFDFVNNPVLHCFLSEQEVKDRGFSMSLYEDFLYPYFKHLHCLNIPDVGIHQCREKMFKEVLYHSGYAIFIGDLIDGVKEEFELAKSMGVKILHLPHIA